jgi:hypothetical protein
MFVYFARFSELHGLPVYPIALFTYTGPRKVDRSCGSDTGPCSSISSTGANSCGARTLSPAP